MQLAYASVLLQSNLNSTPEPCNAIPTSAPLGSQLQAGLEEEK